MPQLLAHVLRYMSLPQGHLRRHTRNCCRQCHILHTLLINLGAGAVESNDRMVPWKHEPCVSLKHASTWKDSCVCLVPTKLRRTSPHISSWIQQFIRNLCERGHHVDRDTPCAKDRIHLGRGEKLSFAEQMRGWLVK